MDDCTTCTSVAVPVADAARQWSADAAMVLPRAIRTLDISEEGTAGRLCD